MYIIMVLTNALLLTLSALVEQTSFAFDAIIRPALCNVHVVGHDTVKYT